MSSLQVDNIQTYSSNPPVIKNVSGTEVGTFCRAWVNFNGTGTVAIRQSFNVSSITDNGVGDYTVNFTTAMPDVNYASVITIGTQVNDGAYGYATLYSAATYTSSAVRFITRNASNNANFDTSINSVAIFR